MFRDKNLAYLVARQLLPHQRAQLVHKRFASNGFFQRVVDQCLIAARCSGVKLYIWRGFTGCFDWNGKLGGDFTENSSMTP